ncbi:MFS transporter [Caldibacillus thermolactis]|uniref:MFS transporter n=1 Tax=Pallidibacillus thermolactis TaxID=251051 RepID=A0ABT2WGV9_9BACI|nr:MFS transporter [Pallidibacillus thermolactis]MCU9594716.1 MFS transporter [Pallidibacillus thermolactis]
MEKQKSKFRWIVFISVLFTYLIMSVQRTAPGLITDQLMVEYQLTASTVGILASIHFFIFTSLQIPMGILVDRYGPDRILFIGSLLTGIGISIYSCSPNEYILLFARVLTGTGDATVWISIVLILSEWFQKNEFTRIIGFAGMTGSIGFLMATVPLSAWIDQNGWRIPFFTIGILLVLCFITLYFVLFKLPAQLLLKNTIDNERTIREGLLQQLKRVFTNRQTLALFFCHFGIVGGFIGFISSWAVPFGIEIYGMSRSEASQMIMTGLFGAIFGAPLASWLSSRLGTIKQLYVFIHILVVSSWFVFLIFRGQPPIILLYFLFILIGFGFGSSVLTFAIVRKHFSIYDSGVVSGVANTGGFLSAVLLPTIFGTILGYFQQTTDHLTHGYFVAFISPVIFSLLGLIGICFVREKEMSTDK